jgi:hypothetical protein
METDSKIASDKNEFHRKLFPLKLMPPAAPLIPRLAGIAQG